MTHTPAPEPDESTPDEDVPEVPNPDADPGSDPDTGPIGPQTTTLPPDSAGT